MKKKLRIRHKMYLGVKIKLHTGVFEVYKFGFNSIVKAQNFIDKLRANGLLTNP